MTYGTCKVIGCRYNNTHTTKRHCCGTCKHNGHGQNECLIKELLIKLQKYNGDFIKKPCTVKDCIDVHTHTTEGHSCLYCDKRGVDEHLPHCPQNKTTTSINSIFDDITLFNSALKNYIEDVNLKLNEYKIYDGGMGCSWIIRNNDDNNEYLFMHSDNWGQYGEDTSHLPRYKAFIYGYILASE